MATRSIQLPVPGPRLIGGNYAPARVTPLLVSTGTEAATEPEIGILRLAFSPTVNEHHAWLLYLPTDYVSGGFLRFHWAAPVASGNVKWRGGSALSASADGADTDAWVSIPMTSTVGASAVPVPAGETKTGGFNYNMTGAAAGYLLWAWVGRFATDSGDTLNADDAYIVAARFEYEDA